ncbi:hypothetical protein AHiyo8_16360 [Arthrobacter sp. Hiyo8]|nr:hypothetical protein AHiyo8_16360 [Arthrobacter sp. Hiyo8]
MEAIVGLQISQPAPVPYLARMSSKEVSSSTRMASKSSWRERLKCSHRALETSMPDFFSSPSRSFLSIGTQEPHWVPAREHVFSSPSSWTGALPSQEPQPLMASRTLPAATLLQEQRIASSGSSVSGRPRRPQR